MTPVPDERLTVGLVRGLHGLSGAVRVEILSDEPGRFGVGSVLHLEGDEGSLTVAWAQEDGPGLLLRFAELTSREAVQDLRNRYLEADAGSPLPPDRYYWHELLDVPVFTSSGEALGRVVDVFRAGGGEVLSVRGGARGEVLVPTVSAVMTEFAPRDGRIVVDPEALDLSTPRPRARAKGRRTTRALRDQVRLEGQATPDGPAVAPVGVDPDAWVDLDTSVDPLD